MWPICVSWLNGSGDREGIEPMPEGLARGRDRRLHDFISNGLWDSAPLDRQAMAHEMDCGVVPRSTTLPGTAIPVAILRRGERL
jgi:hypothetical protein